jgi:putative acyl-CoA dehydrogenase
MEAHGGAGYIEDGVMPRIFRQSPLNSIWEGSGNVICLDVLRAMSREPDSVAALLEELELARGGNAHLDHALDRIKDRLPSPVAESSARRLAEDLALALQASLLVRHTPAAVSDTFCAMRLAYHSGQAYGASGTVVDTGTILMRAMPQF